MKKIYFLAGAVAALVAVSCAKEQGKVDNPSPTPAVTEEEDTTPVPILFGSKLNIVETKAAVEVWNNAHNPLFIYGLEDAGTTAAAPQYKLTGAKPFINNVMATPPTTTTQEANSQRQRIVVNNPAGTGENPEPFYYAESAKYNFFGYYVDDAAGDYTAQDPQDYVHPAPDVDAPEGTVNKITLPVTINGTQDILLAKTDKEEDLINRQDTGKPIASTDKLYSAYSARRGVNPNLNFEHQLSRFVFSIKKGGTVEGNKITINSLKVESYAAGTLTIVGAPTEVANQSWNEEQGKFIPATSVQNLYLVPEIGDNENPVARTYLPITTLNNDTAIEAGNTLNIHPGDDYDDPIGDIMVYPGQDVYNFDLDILQDGITATIPTQHLQIEMAKVIKNGASAGVQFAEPGKQYNVNLIVYGAEKVDITVTLSDWEQVGEINIDPDEQDEIDSYVPTLTLTDSIEEGETTNASVSVMKGGSPVTAGLAITYESKNTNVATVDANGVVTGEGAGTTKIVAKIVVTANNTELGTIYAAKAITVTPLAAAVVTAKVNGSEEDVEWTYGTGLNFTISGSATLGGVAIDPAPASTDWTYSVSENTILQVNAQGVVSLKDGATSPTQNTNITFTATLARKAGSYNGASDTVTITVHPAAQP